MCPKVHFNYSIRYDFSSRHIAGFGEVVTSLCGIFNNSEEHKAWFFYSPPNTIIDKALSRVRLTGGMEVVARYEEFTREDQMHQVNKTEVPKK